MSSRTERALELFFAQAVVVAPAASVPAKTLWKAYKEWHKERLIHPALWRGAVCQYAYKLGATSSLVRGETVLRGIGLADDKRPAATQEAADASVAAWFAQCVLAHRRESRPPVDGKPDPFDRPPEAELLDAMQRNYRHWMRDRGRKAIAGPQFRAALDRLGIECIRQHGALVCLHVLIRREWMRRANGSLIVTSAVTK